MSNVEYEIPEGMMNAARTGWSHDTTYLTESWISTILIAAIRWIAENPIVPGELMTQKMFDTCGGDWDKMWAEWQRRMFLKQDIPEALKHLLAGSYTKEVILAAYELGKKEACNEKAR